MNHPTQHRIAPVLVALALLILPVVAFSGIIPSDNATKQTLEGNTTLDVVGKVDVQDGGAINVLSGATLEIADGAVLSFDGTPVAAEDLVLTTALTTALADYAELAGAAFTGPVSFATVARLIPSESAGSCGAGQAGNVYFDTSDAELCYRNGTAWGPIDAASAADCASPE